MAQDDDMGTVDHARQIARPGAEMQRTR
jgi:hypothetical protein